MTKEIILVTGANGFIGKKLCQKLQERGLYIRALLRKESEGPWNDFIVCDLVSEQIHLKDMKNVVTIYHFAGKAHALNEINSTESEYDIINVEGTRKLLEAAATAGVHKFIFCSSVKACGEGDESILNEKSPCNPVNYYGNSKLKAEKLVLDKNDIPHKCVIRPSMVYGPGNPGNLSMLITIIGKGLFPPIPKINNMRSMVHIDDVISATILVAEKEVANQQIFNITDGEYYSTSQIIRWIRYYFGYKDKNFTLPYILFRWLAKSGDFISIIIRKKVPFTTDNLNKLFGSSAYDSSKIQNLLGFKPKWSLAKALPAIIDKVQNKKSP